MLKNLLLSLFIFVTYATTVTAKEIPQRPDPPRLVNDFANVFSSQQAYSLEQKLIKYNDTTSTQITVVVENTLDGDDAFDYSVRLAQAWGIGQKGKNNGLLIYVAVQDRKVRIQVGYGLEGVITDAFSKRVIEEVIKPNFKQGQYYEGIDQAVDYLIAKASGQFQSDGEQGSGKKKGSGLFVLFIIIIIVLYIISKFKNGGSNYNRGGSGTDIWTAMLLGSALGSGRGSSYGDFSRGGGSFGGFGGGSFGGGGAGGDW